MKPTTDYMMEEIEKLRQELMDALENIADSEGPEGHPAANALAREARTTLDKIKAREGRDGRFTV